VREAGIPHVMFYGWYVVHCKWAERYRTDEVVMDCNWVSCDCLKGYLLLSELCRSYVWVVCLMCTDLPMDG
jgi:hypothetical protein